MLDGTARRAPSRRGAYVLVAADDPDVVLVGTGSEVHVRVAAADAAGGRGHPRPGRVAAVLGPLRRRSPTTTRTRCSRPRCRRWPSRPASRSAGTAGPTTPSASTASAPRRPATGAGRARVHPRARRRRAPAQLLDDLEEPHDATDAPPARAARARAEPVARQPAPRLDHRAASWPRWVDRGIRGLTSNPSIFQKAISTGHRLRRAVRRPRRRRARRVDDAYWELVIDDIEGALRLLRPVYDESDGVDGFVSVEVAPDLARDTGRHRGRGPRAARADRRAEPLREDPGTAEGVAADPADDRRGPQHQRHPDLQPRALRRGDRGLPGRARGAPRATCRRIASVASFFVCRVDTEVDRRLDAIGTARGPGPRGKAAVAQAQLAYQLFLETLPRPRWDALAARGARVQRPLWASTSTKNPATPTRSTSTR